MSLPGGNQPPYRAPCSGSASCFAGPRYQHARADEKNILVFIDDTQLPNAYVPPRGDLVPYERFADIAGGPNCAPEFCDANAAPCVPWIGAGGNTGSSPQFDLTYPPPTPTFYQPQMLTGASIVDGGANYQPGDLLSANGGTLSTFIAVDPSYLGSTALISIGQVSNTGAIQTFAIAAPGSYANAPSSSNLPAGGHGTGAEFDFTFGNQIENISPCQKYGYKNVQAKRQWHGQPGYFFNSNPALYTCTDPTYGDNCSSTIYEQYSLSASQTKYLAASCEVTGTFQQAFCCDPFSDGYCTYDPPFTDTYSVDLTLNSESGVITVDSASYGCGAAASVAFLLQYSLDDFISMFCDLTYAMPTTPPNVLAACQITPQSPPESYFSISCSDTGFSFSGYSGEGDTYPEQSGSSSWTFGDGSFSATRTCTTTDSDDDDPGTFDGCTVTMSIDITDDSMTYTYEQQVETESVFTTTYNFTVSVSLSSTNTAEDVLADAYTLADEWDMTDDAQYPWRTDSYTSIAPLVTRNEVQENVSLLSFLPSVFTQENPEVFTTDCAGLDSSNPLYTDTCAQSVNSDPNGLVCDGSIIGAPLPAGYQQTFDYYYTDWESCDESGHGDFVGFIQGWGKRNQAQNGIPRTATHWTTNDLAWQFPGSAWIFYNYNTSGVDCDGGGSFPPGPSLVIQKWAETKMGFPSENFFRPAGDDKFAYDENHVYTIQNITGSGSGAQVELQLCFSCDSPNGSSQPLSNAGLWGGPSVNGFYTLSSISNGQTVTLGTKVYNVPSNWKSASDTGSGESSYCFGLLRWSNGVPSSDPPPILGRANISNFAMYNGSNSVTELTTDTLPNLGMGVSNADHVDIFDNTMTLLSANAAVTRIDDSHFTVPVGFSSLTNARFLMSNGAPNYAWDDQYPKGDYVYIDWTYWPRLICEVSRMNTLISGCDSGNCACPNGSWTEYCFPFFNPAQDNAGTFTNAFHQEANCIAFTPCSPSVLCISPNDEAFDTGATYGFPNAGGLYLDEQYGSGWIAEFQQVILDPLWQTPHFPASSIANCNSSNNAFEWTQDDGGCQADNPPPAAPAVEYYPTPPLVEARITEPSGAPALPNGISLGWASPAGVTADCGSPAADIIFPPPPNGYGLSAPQPVWSFWGLECDCIANSGRFANQYQNEVVGCS